VPLTHWVGRGTGRPKDKDEVNAADLARARPTLLFKPDEKAERRK
jgi:hypothetical protein